MVSDHPFVYGKDPLADYQHRDPGSRPLPGFFFARIGPVLQKVSTY